ncbi:P-loop containing nucleoside triphosphate hydrolase protein [Mycena capillaripes]|nr:P-loop containing nucleoside triphosphate hydrolase protein [Mycena capillaripes]
MNTATKWTSVADGAGERTHCAALAFFHHNPATDIPWTRHKYGPRRPQIERVALMAAAATKVQWEQTGTEDSESLGKRRRPTFPEPEPEPSKRPRPTPSAQLQKYMDLNKVTFTEEHDTIFRAAKTHDIILTAPFGVGKTTILEAIVAGAPDERTLILTRGRLHRQAIGSRLEESGCKLAFVLTLSTFASLLFPGKNAWHSDGMAEVMRLGLGPDWDVNGYKRVVVDEFQDCKREEYYMIYTALKVLRQRHDVRLIFIGNECQSLFASLGGDSRYLQFADRDLGLFGPTRQWKRFTLRQAFRTTNCDAAFINNIFLCGQEDRHLVGSREGRRPIYIYGSYDEDLLKSIVSVLTPLIEEFGVEGIAILMPSTRNIGNRLPAKLLNTLKGLKYDVVQPDGDAPLDPAVFVGKIAVANYHQFQGLERPVVLVLGLEESYFTYYGTNLPTDRCPEAVLLALTRAKMQLILVHCARHATMRFVRADRIEDYTDFRPVYTTNLLRRGQAVLPSTLPPRSWLTPTAIVETDLEAGRSEAVGNVTSLIFIAAAEQKIKGTIRTLNAQAGDFPELASEQVSWLARAAISCDTERSGVPQVNLSFPTHAASNLPSLGVSLVNLCTYLGWFAGNLQMQETHQSHANGNL